MWFSVDVETDGPCPPMYSMVSFGVVCVSEKFEGFTRNVAPISDAWDPEALAISGVSRTQHLDYPDPGQAITDLDKWIQSVNKNGRPVFVADNPGFDFAWMNYYFHKYLGRNPFGWSARRIGDLYCGLMKDTSAQWKHLRTTRHDHNPLNDALGNAEALFKMKEMGLKGF